MYLNNVGHGEVRVYRGTGVSRGVRRTTWERSLQNWELQISCFEELVFGWRERFGTRPSQSPSRFGIRLHFLRPHFPSPNNVQQTVSGKIGRECLQTGFERRACMVGFSVSRLSNRQRARPLRARAHERVALIMLGPSTLGALSAENSLINLVRRRLLN